MGKVAKIVFRLIRGRVVPVKAMVPEMAASGLRHEIKTIQNYKAALKGFKEFRVNQFSRANMYRPGGIKDPVRMADDAKLVEAHRMKTLSDGIMKRFGKDDISQAAGKKSVEKAQGFVKGIEGIFKTDGHDKVRHFTNKEISLLAGKPPSKADFLEHMNDNPKFDIGDAFEMLGKREQGASGRLAMQSRLHMRRHDAMRIQRAVNAQVKIVGGGPSKIDRIVSARGKGITFQKIGGKIKPVRKK